MTGDAGWLEPTRYELQRLLGLVEDLQTSAEAVRGSVAEAPIRARIVEVLEGVELLLRDLRATEGEHYVDSPFDWEDDVPLDLSAHASRADSEYRRAHFYAKGWTEAQPELVARTRPRGEIFDERVDAFGALVAGRYDHQALGSAKAEWAIGMKALAYATGHGWHLAITEAELDGLVREVAPHLVPERLDELDAGATG